MPHIDVSAVGFWSFVLPVAAVLLIAGGIIASRLVDRHVNRQVNRRLPRFQEGGHIPRRPLDVSGIFSRIMARPWVPPLQEIWLDEDELLPWPPRPEPHVFDQELHGGLPVHRV